MPNPTGKRNKLAARSLVIVGTLLAGAAIWMSVINSAAPSSQATSVLSETPVSAIPSTVNNNEVAATVQTPVQTTPVPRQQVVPRFRTRGS